MKKKNEEKIEVKENTIITTVTFTMATTLITVFTLNERLWRERGGGGVPICRNSFSSETDTKLKDHGTRLSFFPDNY